MRLGGVQARYADSISGSAAAASVHAAAQSGALRAGLDLMHARVSSGAGSSTQGTFAFTAVRGLTPASAAGLRGQASASFLSGGTTALSGTAEAFAALLRGGWLGSLAVSAGGVRDVERLARPVYGATVAARRQAGPLLLEGRGALTLSRAVRFTDLTAGLEWERGRLRLGGAAGARLGDLGGDALLQAHAELRVLPAAFLEAALGSYPRDLTGFTSGRFVNAGIRLQLARPAAATLPVAVERLGGSGGARVTFEVPDASDVAIVGEWNQWRPAPLTRLSRGRWQVLLPLAPGAYRFSLVVGGRWVVPPGVPRLPDDFGGEVGVLVI